MPLDHLSGAALISGAAFVNQTKGRPPMKLIVTSAILIGGQHQDVGTEIDVADAFGRELIASNKAVPADSPAGEATRRLVAEAGSGGPAPAPDPAAAPALQPDPSALAGGKKTKE